LKCLLDTNILISDRNAIDVMANNFDGIIICSQVLEELDGLKKGLDETGYNARKAIHRIEELIEESDNSYGSNIEFITTDAYQIPDGWDSSKRDNKIIACAKQNKAMLITNDINMFVKAKSIGVQVKKHDKTPKICDYKGYKEIVLNQEEQCDFYSNVSNNKWGLLLNEYLIIKNEENEVIDKLKWTEKGFTPIIKKTLDSMMFGKIKPKDVYQELAIDSLNSDGLTILAGKAGTAKTLMSLAYIFQKLQGNKIDKCIIIHNAPPMNKSSSCGFYPGSRTEKLLSGSLGGILASKLGDISMVETLINQGKLMLIPLSDARGFEASENSILYVTEGQNMDAYLLKTVLQRAKDGTKVIIEGDVDEQVDNIAFAGDKNGMRRAIDIFKGTEIFSCVNLQNIYRGKIAEIADGM
jgi:PhoH-like ATPase